MAVADVAGVTAAAAGAAGRARLSVCFSLGVVAVLATGFAVSAVAAERPSGTQLPPLPLIAARHWLWVANPQLEAPVW
jgi:hypothetical protein